MKLHEFGIGLVVTGLTFFFGMGVAVRFLPMSAALFVGLLTWFGCAFAFVRSLKGKPATQRS